MKICYLSDTWPWFGKHQCYSRLIHHIKQVQPQTRAVMVNYGLLDKVIGRLYNLQTGNSWRGDNVFAAAEFKFSKNLGKAFKKEDIYHILFFDTHYQLFSQWQKAPKNVITTIHHPIGRDYPPCMEDNLKRISSAIVMYSEGVEHFEKYIGKGRVKFIQYGVDTEFFFPRQENIYNERRLFFTGQNGRNTNMLKRIILKLINKYPEIKIDMLVPETLKKTDFRELVNYSTIRWHHNLSEIEVRGLYQKSYLLLMPMQDSGVNTAIVEALACGIPIITTDVGGARNYGAGTIYPAVENNDDRAMVGLIEKYLSDAGWRNEVGKKCREFAEQNLAWPLIAKRHLEVYKELNT